MLSTLQRTACLFLVFLFVAAPAVCAGDKAGIVLMHGKDGSPSSVANLAGEMRNNGFIVVTPEMPFSARRQMDRSFEDCLAEIDEAVAFLKTQGARTIFIAGHSLGASVALYYGTKNPVAGVLAIAPGGNTGNLREAMEREVMRAREMVAQGKGDEKGVFDDFNQRRRYTRKTTARIFLSYTDPDGPAPIPKNAAALKPGTALLWVVGKKDPMYGRGQSFAFDKAPPNSRNKYVVVEAGHVETLFDADATKQIVAWIKDF